MITRALCHVWRARAEVLSPPSALLVPAKLLLELLEAVTAGRELAFALQHYHWPNSEDCRQPEHPCPLCDALTRWEQTVGK